MASEKLRVCPMVLVPKKWQNQENDRQYKREKKVAMFDKASSDKFLVLTSSGDEVCSLFLRAASHPRALTSPRRPTPATDVARGNRDEF